jgi:hypothetical protein
MASSVKFLSFRPCTIGNLRPAPNVTDSEEIHAAVSADQSPCLEPTPADLKDKHLKIISSYRSALIWLEGGVMIYRNDPKTEGGHGYAGWPPKGTMEEVIVGDDWFAEVEFV